MSNTMLICENAHKCLNAVCEHKVPHLEKNNCITQPCNAHEYGYPSSMCKITDDRKTNRRW